MPQDKASAVIMEAFDRLIEARLRLTTLERLPAWRRRVDLLTKAYATGEWPESFGTQPANVSDISAELIEAMVANLCSTHPDLSAFKPWGRPPQGPPDIPRR